MHVQKVHVSKKFIYIPILIALSNKFIVELILKIKLEICKVELISNI